MANNVGGKRVATIINRSNRSINLLLRETTYPLAKSQVLPNKDGTLRLKGGSSITVEYHRLNIQQIASMTSNNLIQIHMSRSGYVYEAIRMSWATLTEDEWQDMAEIHWQTLS